MKHALIHSILAVLTALLLSILALHTAAPAPSKESESTDSSLIFTAKTDAGIETVTMAEYLPGVVAGEMPALFESEALKAQAVAARTYIMHRTLHPSPAHPEADICNNAACCKAYCSEETLRSNWGDNYEKYAQKIKSAATDTDGQCLTYENQWIEAVFHSSSAGATESSGAIWNDRPYLISVYSPETAEDVPNFITEAMFTPDHLKELLSAADPNLTFPADPAIWFGNTIPDESGRVASVSVCGKDLSGALLRSTLGLRSSAFTISYEHDVFTFTVTGYGHGVGLSQYGANVFAKQGLSYDQILAHYYPNTQLTSAAG